VADQLDRTIDELLRSARAAAKIDLERIELFEKMIRTPAWQAYVGLLEAKLQMFADQMLKPSGSVDGCIALEYVKGAMSGLVMARDTPTVTIAAKDQIRQPATEEADDDDE